MIMKDGIILWEAHRAGAGGVELPESCLAAFEYGWELGGRPEADVNITADGVMVSLHDQTVDRICPNAPEHLRGKIVSEITWAELQTVDVGWPEFPDQHIASLEQLFAILQEYPERNMVIDYKRVSIKTLADMIKKYGVGKQITFACNDPALLREFKSYVPEGRTKNWLGGTAEVIKEKFARIQQENFQDITEVQLHLNDAAGKSWRYDLDPEFVSSALQITKKHGVLLQVLPWKFERSDLFAILDLGVRSFAVDYPNKFKKVCADYFTRH
jgi:glycerophosphoryl diester phosphodiesterase